MYRDLPKDLFITSIIQDYAFSEQDLDATRSLFFESLKSHEDFPFHVDSDLKKRVLTRRCDPITVKLAHDIHSLLSVMEGEDYCILKDMISSSKRRTMSQTPSASVEPNSCSQGSTRSNCHCQNDVSLLKDTVSSLQAEILLLKQSVNATNFLRSEQVEHITNTMQGLKEDVRRYAADVSDLSQPLSSSALRELHILVESLISTLDHRVSSIEKFLDSTNIHVVSVADTVKERLGSTADGNPNSLNQAQCVYDNEGPIMFGNTLMPIKNTICNNVTDVHEIERFLQGSCSVDKHQDLQSLEITETLKEPSYVPQNPACGVSNTAGYTSIPVRITTRTTGSQTDDYMDFPVLNGRSRMRSKRFYVGGFDTTVTADDIASLVSRKGPKVTMVRIFPSRRQSDRVIIRLNVEADDNAELVTKRRFWPKGIVCRPWLSRAALQKRHGDHPPLEHQEYNRTQRGQYVKQSSNGYYDFTGIETYNRYDTLNVDVD